MTPNKTEKFKRYSYQFSLLVNQISDIVELFNCGVRKKGNSMAFFPLLSIRLLCSGNWYQ
ncbi:MAG: hypothetical protein E3V96_05985 [Wolbachia pipientis]|nr:hypothetical protein [Wolbachia pipientis]